MKLDNNELITVCGGQDKTMLTVWSVCWTGLSTLTDDRRVTHRTPVLYLTIVNKFNNLLNFLNNVYQISSPELLAAVHQSCLPAPDSRHNTIKDTAIYYASCSSTTSVTINSLILVAVVHLVVQLVLSTAPAINDILQRICNAVCCGVCNHVSAISILSTYRPSQTHLGICI